MMREEITRDIDVRPSSVALWFGALAGPIAFLIDLQIKYAIVQYVCRNRAEWIFWLTAAVCLALSVVGALTSWSHAASDDQRVHFMGLAGTFVSALFALTIISMAIPDLFLKSCD